MVLPGGIQALLVLGEWLVAFLMKLNSFSRCIKVTTLTISWRLRPFYMSWNNVVCGVGARLSMNLLVQDYSFVPLLSSLGLLTFLVNGIWIGANFFLNWYKNLIISRFKIYIIILVDYVSYVNCKLLRLQ